MIGRSSAALARNVATHLASTRRNPLHRLKTVIRTAVWQTSAVDCEALTCSRMHGLVSSAGAAEILAGEIRDDLVQVHVDRDTSAAGEHVDRKLREMFAANERVACAFDRILTPRIDRVRIAIGPCGRLFDDRKSANVVGIVCEDSPRESQVLDGSDCVNSVQRVGGNRALAQQIFFDASPG